jgi:hypothetical protein
MMQENAPNPIDYATPATTRRQSPLGAAIRFVIAFVICTIIFEFVWDLYVMDTLYHCTDSLGLNYIRGPSSWVHGNVMSGPPRTDADTIAAGWDIGMLELMWLSLIVLSLVLSGAAAWLPVRNRRRG